MCEFGCFHNFIDIGCDYLPKGVRISRFLNSTCISFPPCSCSPIWPSVRPGSSTSSAVFLPLMRTTIRPPWALSWRSVHSPGLYFFWGIPSLFFHILTCSYFSYKDIRKIEKNKIQNEYYPSLNHILSISIPH